MDPQKLVDMLAGTIHPDTRENSEKQLDQVHKIIGFNPTLLCAVMNGETSVPVRQAGVIYLKNMVVQYWQVREAKSPIEQVPYSIHENDKVFIRDNILKAMISSPQLIRVQLGVCLRVILKEDYPGRWPGVVDIILGHLMADDIHEVYGALDAVYQLVKNYEYKKPDERGPLDGAMRKFLPPMYQRITHLIDNQTEASLLIKKLILKIFHALIQFHLSLDLINKEFFAQWMAVLQRVVESPVPEESNKADIEDRPELACWKLKKWALHILVRTFERYGNPGNVVKLYTQFANWYLKSFTPNVIVILLNVLIQYAQKVYVSPRVLQESLNYINTGISHAASWKVLKPHMPAIVEGVLFPLMCYTDDDDALWNEDPYEYIKFKFDVFEDFVSPVTAAQTVLHSAAKKRKEILPKTMGFCLQILCEPKIDPRKKDGALHMIGTLAEILLKKKMYKDKMEEMLVTHVFPEFQNELGYMRARANWVMHTFSKTTFKNYQNLCNALDMTRVCLVSEKEELPVRVEAAFALQALISSGEKAEKYIIPHVEAIVKALLVVIRETENDDLTNVMQKLIHTYQDTVTPIAVVITQHLATTFAQVINSEEGTDDKAMTAMGILNTIETLLMVVEKEKEIVLQLENIILEVVGVILQNHVLEFYEEVFSLIFSMTVTHVSQPLWQVFRMMHETFAQDGFDYFIEMMPAFHNFVTVDPPAFLSDPMNLQIIFNITTKILTSETDEDCEAHAAKLLEVVVLQFRGQINQVIPSIVELTLGRLTREITSTELRQMCLQVIVAVLYTEPVSLIQLLSSLEAAVLTQFIQQWLHDTDCFLGLHDRKVCVLGLCALMSLPQKPPVIRESAKSMIPALLLLFKGLKRAYEYRAGLEEEEDDDDEDDEYDPDVLESDESDVEDADSDYLAQLEKLGEDEDDDDQFESFEETVLEGFTTPLDEDECPEDEYVIFMNTLQELQAGDPAWYQELTAHLNAEQQKELEDVVTLAKQKRAVQETKKIEKAGGYQFQSTAVPTSFNFGS